MYEGLGRQPFLEEAADLLTAASLQLNVPEVANILGLHVHEPRAEASAPTLPQICTELSY